MSNRIVMAHLPKDIQGRVWKQHFRDLGHGPCPVCEEEIDVFQFQVGHIQARAKGGPDTLDNLLPICGPCNNAMRTTNLFAYKARHYSKGNLKNIITQTNSLNVEDLQMLQAYVDHLLETKTPKPVVTLIEQEKLDKADKVEQQNRERDDRAARRFRSPLPPRPVSPIPRSPSPYLEVPTSVCQYIFQRGERKGEPCRKPTSDGEIFCSVCKNKKTAQKMLDP